MYVAKRQRWGREIHFHYESLPRRNEDEFKKKKKKKKLTVELLNQAAVLSC